MPSARWLRQELPVQRMRTVGFMSEGFALIPVAAFYADAADREHDGHLDEYADDRGQGGGGWSGRRA